MDKKVISDHEFKPLVKKFVINHSKDDQTISYKQGVKLAKDLGIKLISTAGRGHINKENQAILCLE
ncbi:TPA: hypothetical protein DDW69_01050 [candidate division CPR2 bacterium]|nr:MAG: hypothetical protein UT60_C0025G0004 [candidate division CPR2 bacterium GW2011_GWD2_39_7]KKR28637.1 MAG: hypothetical protein UT59_C0022G0005 [candidate division CPR2 bacterium GW2011_GWD1_39_7]OGB61320.1 MAG: hypothetical protein A2Y27_02680 [candidate division CPR2 bacterium GWD1_39_7]OGB72356.1 MAG: hypothetical protein A2Y26_02405 [candidate division CPR2 bacterium GWD2_39_7]HBG81406.1 hypothetical protein [candidate division CPR2 bacterium]